MPLVAAKQARAEVPVLAIVNPASGPGSRIDANYVNGLSLLKDSGIQTIAYVHTSYGNRAFEEVTRDIDEYSRLYGKTFDGVFIDEMSKTDAEYYGRIASYAKKGGFALVVGNPGSDVPSHYIDQAGDAFVIYENSGVPSFSFLGGWHSAYERRTWAFIAHHTPVVDPGAIAQFKDLVGLLYVTEGYYHSFPSYLSELFALL
jgi:hypothetical protein